MKYDDILTMIEEDFSIELNTPQKAATELYRVPHLTQKYMRLMLEETRRLTRLEDTFERIKKVLRAAYWRGEKGGIRIYEDDLVGLENLDFGFDPLEGPDHLPKLVEDRNICIETNPAYAIIKGKVKNQRELVDLLKNIYQYQISKNRIDTCRIILDDYKRSIST